MAHRISKREFISKIDLIKKPERAILISLFKKAGQLEKVLIAGLEPNVGSCVGTFPRTLQLSSEDNCTRAYLCNRDHYIGAENPKHIIEEETAEQHASRFVVWQ